MHKDTRVDFFFLLTQDKQIETIHTHTHTYCVYYYLVPPLQSLFSLIPLQIVFSLADGGGYAPSLCAPRLPLCQPTTHPQP